MKVCSVRLLVFSLLLFGGAVAAALNLKEAPESGIFDEAQFLDERFISDIGYRINYERTHREFEVFVIVFDEEPTQGAKILAKQAGESWSKGEYWAVIYQVGANGEPECLAGGAKISQLPTELVEYNLRGARSTAMMVDTPQSRLQEMVNNLTDAFGLLRVQANEKYEAAVKEHYRIYEAKKRRKEGLKFAAIFGAIGLIVFAFIAFQIWKKYFRNRQPLLFPETSPRRRLDGPFAGGGDVLVKYGRRR